MEGRNRTSRPYDSRRTKEHILAAAEAVFARRGFSGARVDAIAAASGYNKSLIYQYFGDKMALYTEVVKRVDRKGHEAVGRTLGRSAGEAFIGITGKASAGSSGKAASAITKATSGITSEAPSGITPKAPSGITSEAPSDITPKASSGITSEASSAMTDKAAFGAADEASAGIGCGASNDTPVGVFAGTTGEKAVDAAGFQLFLTRTVEGIFDFLLDHPAYLQILFWEAAEGWKTWNQLDYRPDDATAAYRLVERARADGIVRADFDPAMFPVVVMAATAGIIRFSQRFGDFWPGGGLPADPAARRQHIISQASEFIKRGIMEPEPAAAER